VSLLSTSISRRCNRFLKPLSPMRVSELKRSMSDAVSKIPPILRVIRCFIRILRYLVNFKKRLDAEMLDARFLWVLIVCFMFFSGFVWGRLRQ
jgi:hypothetical protein